MLVIEIIQYTHCENDLNHLKLNFCNATAFVAHWWFSEAHHWVMVIFPITATIYLMITLFYYLLLFFTIFS